MKRLGNSDSLGGLMSICNPTAGGGVDADQDHEHSSSPRKSNSINNQARVGVDVGVGLGLGYSRDFQSMMLDGLVDEDGCLEDSLVAVGGGHVLVKKRRLSVEQVKALEKNFEVENKLEPERKIKLAQELGLQPRQVAVWFQNRRARWKTKQLERDYGVLKSNYDSLKQSFEALKQDNEALLKEIRVLKSKLNDDDQEMNTTSTEIDNLWAKEEAAFGSETDNPAPSIDAPETEPGPVLFKSMTGVLQLPPELKVVVDGPSDSDSSAIINEESNSTTTSTSPPPNNNNNDNNNNNNNDHSCLLELEVDLELDPFSPTSTITTNTTANNFCRFNSSSPSSITTYFNLHQSTANVILGGAGDDHLHHPTTTAATIQPPFVKMEEHLHDFFNEEIEMDQEACCNFFSEDQAPTLHHLYCSSADQWA